MLDVHTWAFLALRQRNSVFRAAERLLELFEAASSEEHVGELVRDRYEELLELRRWLTLDRFDRRAINRSLAEHFAGRGERVA